MASKGIIAKRYAKALVQSLSGDAAASEKVLGDLETLGAAYETNNELNSFLESPVFSSQEKWTVIEELLNKGEADKQTVAFLKTVALADRSPLLPELVSSVKELLREAQGAAEAVIETAYALSDDQVSTVQKSLEKSLNKKLYVRTEVKESLVAGIRVTVDGKTYDGTLGAHLNKLERTLLQAEA